MGSNFNILEYADPELDEFTSNEKTNFLNDFVNSTSDPTKIKYYILSFQLQRNKFNT